MAETIQKEDGDSEFFDKYEPLDGIFLTQRQIKRKLRKSRRNSIEPRQTQTSQLILKPIVPLSVNQNTVFEAYAAGKNLMNVGVAGTGKTFLAIWLALNDTLNKEKYKKIIIVRTSVQSRDMGFLPGKPKEKMDVFQSPYVSIFSKLFGRADAYEILRKKGIVEFESTAFLRGETFNDSIVIFDEMQNSSFSELQTVITRIGENSKIIFCGDYGQNDLNFSKYDISGLPKFMNIIKRMKEFAIINFDIDDICRSGLVKSFYIALAKEETFVHTQTNSKPKHQN